MPQEKINPWVIALRILFTLALIWAVVFIFSNSMEVAQVSSAHSDEVLALVNPILAKVNLGPLTSHQIRKLAHFAEYTLLGFLAMLCLRVYTRRFVRHISWPLLFGLLALGDVNDEQHGGVACAVLSDRAGRERPDTAVFLHSRVRASAAERLLDRFDIGRVTASDNCRRPYPAETADG